MAAIERVGGVDSVALFTRAQGQSCVVGEKNLQRRSARPVADVDVAAAAAPICAPTPAPQRDLESSASRRHGHGRHTRYQPSMVHGMNPRRSFAARVQLSRWHDVT
jgi:hypothetical protein